MKKKKSKIYFFASLFRSVDDELPVRLIGSRAVAESISKESNLSVDRIEEIINCFMKHMRREVLLGNNVSIKHMVHKMDLLSILSFAQDKMRIAFRYRCDTPEVFNERD